MSRITRKTEPTKTEKAEYVWDVWDEQDRPAHDRCGAKSAHALARLRTDDGESLVDLLYADMIGTGQTRSQSPPAAKLRPKGHSRRDTQAGGSSVIRARGKAKERKAEPIAFRDEPLVVVEPFGKSSNPDDPIIGVVMTDSERTDDLIGDENWRALFGKGGAGKAMAASRWLWIAEHAEAIHDAIASVL